MKRLHQLCRAVRTINPEARLIFHSVADHEDAWVIRIMVADIILVETAAGELDKVLDDAISGINKLSERIRVSLMPQPDDDLPSVRVPRAPRPPRGSKPPSA